MIAKSLNQDVESLLYLFTGITSSLCLYYSTRCLRIQDAMLYKVMVRGLCETQNCAQHIRFWLTNNTPA